MAKKKKMKRMCIGLLIAVIVTGGVMAYGIPRLYASPQEKKVKMLQQSGETLYNIMESYIDKIMQLNPMGNNNYSGNIRVSEFTYDGIDYRPDMNNKIHPYSIHTDNNNITLSIPDVQDGTLTVDKNDILKYGLAKISPDQLEPMLRAVLSHVKEGWETAVRDNNIAGKNIKDNSIKGNNIKDNNIINTIKENSDNRMTDVTKAQPSEANIQTGIQYNTYDNASSISMVISDETLITAFNTALEESYRDSAILPYISLLNVNGITKDNIKQKFAEYARGVYTTCNMYIDSQEKLTNVELIFSQIETGDDVGNISVVFNGDKNMYDGVEIKIHTSAVNDTYMDTVMQLDMQDMNNVQYSIDADVRYHRHSMQLKAEGNIKQAETCRKQIEIPAEMAVEKQVKIQV